MGIHVIKMPDIGEGIAEVEVVTWRVNPGDVIVDDQILADVMTDKATIEIPSPVAGKVMTLGGRAGELMAVGAELIRIEVEGKGNVDAAAAAPAPTPAPIAAAPKAEAPPAPKPAAPVAAKEPAKLAPVSKPVAAPAAALIRKEGEKPLASPAVRRRAWDLGIELQFVNGSGTAGNITHQDLDAYVARGGQQTSSSGGGASYRQRDDEEAIPVIGLRRKIAQKMQESKRRIPHFTYVEEIDMTDLETLRATLNNKWGKERGRLTVLPFLMRAMILAIREFPQMNARYDDDAGIVTRYGAVHMGVATQTESGLMVPVVRHAETLDLWGSAAAVVAQAEAARTGKAAREDLSGSTITLTSLGNLGGIVSTPVINHPEVAIVGVNRMVQRPVIRGGAVVARQMMNLSSSFDHRVVDGMHAAEFIQMIRGFLECPATLFME